MNNYKFLFSIIIPTYNRETDLDRCLKSLVEQTYKDFEVIVCDNGSSDNTKAVAMDYVNKLNLSYIFIEENSGGPAAPRNLGIEKALGQWVCFLDSDDWYTSDRLEYISNLDLNIVDFLYHNLEIVKKGKRYKTMTCRKLSSTNTYYSLLCNINSIPTSSTCIRNEMLKKTNGFNESKNISGLEDFELWLKLAKVNVKFRYIPVVLGYYAVGNDNFTYHDERQVNRYKALYNPIIEHENNRKIRQQVKAVLNYHIACINIKSKQYFKANKLLISCFINGTYQLRKKVFFRFLIGLVSFFK